MGQPNLVACPRRAATISGDAPACPKCGTSMRGTPTRRRLETIIDAFLAGFWQI
jgi:hypothetical protein